MPDTTLEKGLLDGKTFLLSRLQGKKMESDSFSSWLKRYYLLACLSARSNSRAFVSLFGISATQGEGKIQYIFKRTINLEMPYCAFQGAAFSLRSLTGLAWLNFKS